MARLTLEEEHDFDFIVFAINSTAPDYKICFGINSVLNLEMQKEIPFEIQNKNQKEVLQFSMFQYYSEDTFFNYELISNKSFNTVRVKENKKAKTQIDLFEENEEVQKQIGFLIPELDKTDYLFIVRSEYDSTLVKEIEKRLKTIDDLSNVHYVKPSDLASKVNLIF